MASCDWRGSSTTFIRSWGSSGLPTVSKLTCGWFFSSFIILLYFHWCALWPCVRSNIAFGSSSFHKYYKRNQDLCVSSSRDLPQLSCTSRCNRIPCISWLWRYALFPGVEPSSLLKLWKNHTCHIFACLKPRFCGIFFCELEGHIYDLLFSGTRRIDMYRHRRASRPCGIEGCFSLGT